MRDNYKEYKLIVKQIYNNEIALLTELALSRKQYNNNELTK